MPPIRATCVDEESFDVHDLSDTHLFELIFDAVVGGDHVHVGAGGFDFAVAKLSASNELLARLVIVEVIVWRLKRHGDVHF